MGCRAACIRHSTFHQQAADRGTSIHDCQYPRFSRWVGWTGREGGHVPHPRTLWLHWATAQTCVIQGFCDVCSCIHRWSVWMPSRLAQILDVHLDRRRIRSFLYSSPLTRHYSVSSYCSLPTVTISRSCNSNVRLGKSFCRRVEFIWVIRDSGRIRRSNRSNSYLTLRLEHLAWIKAALSEAITSAPSSLVIEPRIFVTRAMKQISETNFVDIEKGKLSHSDSSFSPSSSECNMNTKALAESLIRVSSGRPDVDALIDNAVSASHGPVSVDGE